MKSLSKTARSWIISAALVVFIGAMIFLWYWLTLDRFIRFAVIITIVTTIIAFMLFFVWRRQKGDYEKLPAYLSNVVGLTVAFLNLLLFAAISKKLWFEEHHRWITQIRIQNFNDLADKLHISQQGNKSDSTAIEALYLYLDDKDLNHYFYLVTDDLKILRGIESKLKNNVTTLIQVMRLDSTLSNVDQKHSAIENFHSIRRILLNFLNDIIMKKESRKNYQSFAKNSSGSE